MSQHRVVVTGIGAFSALGKRIQDFWQNAINGNSAIGKIDLEDIETMQFKHGAQIKSYSPEEYFDRKQLMLYDLFTQYMMIAAKEAVNHSKINFQDFPNQEAGVVLGSSIGGQNTQEENYKILYFHRKKRVNPLVIPRIMPNAATSALCMEFGLKGPSYTLSTACSSSNHAIGNAFQLIRNGTCKAMITGGSETPFTYGFLKAWDALRVVSPDTCKPFDNNRKGMILGEGAGVLIFGGTGVLALLLGGNFLDYNTLAHDPLHGQHYGILAVEFGVGVTVTAVIISIFFNFTGRKSQRRDETQ